MKVQTSGVSVPSPQASLYPNWWLFCLIVLSIKLLLFAIDPLPKLFLGDSGSYLWTSFTGLIPPDRSFLYGYVIRWTSRYSGSLSSLLLVQLFFSVLTAIVVALLCRRFFDLSSRTSYLFGIVCAIDPLQVVWERYVLAETISLAIYAVTLLCSFYYLKERRLWQLALVQVLGVCLISFRISYLLVVEANAILLPLFAFLPALQRSWGTISSSPFRSSLQRIGLHLAVSILLFLGLHYSYKLLNGKLSGRAPAYLYTSGFSILAAWAPTLRPEDSPDPRLAQIIQEGDQFRLADMRRRNSQLYSEGSLIPRWKAVEHDLAIADKVAKQTALNSLFHRPLGVVGLGIRTFASYFDFKQIYGQATNDLGRAEWPGTLTKIMALRFRFAPPIPGDAKSFTFLQRRFLKSQPYWYLVLFSPVLCFVLLWWLHESYLLVLLAHATIFLATDCFLTVTASVRYLQPLSFLTILLVALFVKVLSERRRQSKVLALV